MTLKCTFCEDCGWVCEDHPTFPWNEEHLLTCNGAGVSCPWCNNGEIPRLPKGFKSDWDDGHRYN
jgi:flavoprotein